MYNVKLVIYSSNGRRICTTNSLDKPWENDWQYSKLHKYCGKKYLGECSGKIFGNAFKVYVAGMSLSGFEKLDKLCLDSIVHNNVFNGSSVSSSKGWIIFDTNVSPGKEF